MKIVWKCDFCFHSNEDKNKTHEHEVKCSFNPVNKECWTCKHVFQDGAPISGYHNECKQGHSCFDNDEGNNCEYWEGRNLTKPTN